MNIGIIGFGSMGKMLFEKFTASGNVGAEDIFVTNRSLDKLSEVGSRAVVCSTNSETASHADILFLCVRPGDMKQVLEDIKAHTKPEALIVSLNGSIPFTLLENVIGGRFAKVIPSVTAEVELSQTLVCFNGKVSDVQKRELIGLLECMGDCIEVPEEEMGMGSELVSCMPGFIAAIFDVICRSAEKHTTLPKEQIVEMVLRTVSATSELMLRKNMSFEDVVDRVATKGGITEEGTKVIYNEFPDTADELFGKTLAKRRLTADKAKETFGGEKSE